MKASFVEHLTRGSVETWAEAKAQISKAPKEPGSVVVAYLRLLEKKKNGRPRLCVWRQNPKGKGLDKGRFPQAKPDGYLLLRVAKGLLATEKLPSNKLALLVQRAINGGGGPTGPVSDGGPK